MLLRLGARDDHFARRQCGNHGIAGSPALAVPRAADHAAARIARQLRDITITDQHLPDAAQPGRDRLPGILDGIAGFDDGRCRRLACRCQHLIQFGGGVLVLIDDILLHAAELLGRVGLQSGKELREPAFHLRLLLVGQRAPGVHAVFRRLPEQLGGGRWVGRVHRIGARLFRLFLPVVVFLLRSHAGGFEGLQRPVNTGRQVVDIALNLQDARNLQVIALLHQPGQFRDVAGVGPVHVGQLLVVVAGQARGLFHAGRGRLK